MQNESRKSESWAHLAALLDLLAATVRVWTWAPAEDADRSKVADMLIEITETIAPFVPADMPDPAPESVQLVARASPGLSALTPSKEDAGKPDGTAWVLKWPEDGEYLVNDGLEWPEWSPLQRKAHRFSSLAAARSVAKTWGTLRPFVVRLAPKGAR